MSKLETDLFVPETKAKDNDVQINVLNSHTKSDLYHFKVLQL